MPVSPSYCPTWDQPAVNYECSQPFTVSVSGPGNTVDYNGAIPNISYDSATTNVNMYPWASQTASVNSCTKDPVNGGCVGPSSYGPVFFQFYGGAIGPFLIGTGGGFTNNGLAGILGMLITPYLVSSTTTTTVARSSGSLSMSFVDTPTTLHLSVDDKG